MPRGTTIAPVAAPGSSHRRGGTGTTEVRRDPIAPQNGADVDPSLASIDGTRAVGSPQRSTLPGPEGAARLTPIDPSARRGVVPTVLPSRGKDDHGKAVR